MTWTPTSSWPITHCPGALLHPPRNGRRIGCPDKPGVAPPKARHRGPEGIPTFDVQHIHNPASGDEICKVVRFREKTLDSVTQFRQVCFLPPNGIPCRIPKEGSAWLLKVFWDDVLGKVDRREMISLAPSYFTSHNCVLCTKCASGGLYCTRFEHKYPYTFCHRGRSCNGQDRLHNSSLSQTQAGRAKGDPETPEFCCNKIHAPFIHRTAQATCSGPSALYTPLPVSTLDSKKINPLGSPCDSQLDEHRSTGILSVS
ncbi:hypothetical protein BDP81DRAFT_52362 [Colletotrichum phormii]|uniref:Uncharacterized protein n=1 Tax=Colletotrichum phormii TaxID=359342 RepID=A0AAI9ZN57_9PEZI|nr:uncharacterized protein BDP81DRAFT_52362 [Colletotrichum phormii]KAK1634740.1 hypothetical protein BDP81DRAFT_52362 [Colletotrichum phormii]